MGTTQAISRSGRRSGKPGVWEQGKEKPPGRGVGWPGGVQSEPGKRGVGGEGWLRVETSQEYSAASVMTEAKWGFHLDQRKAKAG